jgi:hypothetical protein
MVFTIIYFLEHHYGVQNNWMVCVHSMEQAVHALVRFTELIEDHWVPPYASAVLTVLAIVKPDRRRGGWSFDGLLGMWMTLVIETVFDMSESQGEGTAREGLNETRRRFLLFCHVDL